MKLQTRLTALVSTIIILISTAIGLFAIIITERNEIGRVDTVLGTSINQLINSKDDPLSLALLLADQSDQKFTVSYVSAARDITALNQSSGDLKYVPSDQQLNASLSNGITVTADGLDRIRAMKLPNDEYVVLSVSLADIETAKTQNIRYLFLFTLAMVLMGILISNYLFRKDNELNEVVNSLQKNQESMREFLGDASHELRTPLTVIKGYVELLSKNQETRPEKAAEYYGRVSHEIERMQSLINDLLLIAELEDQTPTSPEIINFSREVSHMSKDLATLQPERPISVNIEPGILVNLSHNYAQQMLANIFSNLRRHTPEDSQVRITLVTKGYKALLTISDAGAGLPQEVYKTGIQYFQRFDRSRSRKSGGSGLGMTIMKRIIERANGSIALQQSEYGGLEIEISLPINRD
jgi:two-component system, OmpR family, sensor kinase